MEQQVAHLAIPGAAVAIVADGKVAWRKSCGWANIAEQVPVSNDTPFGLGSISKTFIAVALMQAIEDGYLTLDTKINDVLPFAVHNPLVDGDAITMRHLVTHTSGIKDNIWTYNFMSYRTGDPQTELGQFLKDYLVPGGTRYKKRGNFIKAQPGIEYEYSNIASGLAAYVIEVATNQPFEKYTHQRIFEPLKMQNTAWFLKDFQAKTAVAMPYNRLGRPYGYLGIASWPDGQLRSSIIDLGRYLAAIMNDGELEGTRILSRESVRVLLSEPLPTLENEEGEAQFVFWGVEKKLIGHNGGDPGVFTLMYFDSEIHQGGIVLTNTLTRNSTRGSMIILQQLLRFGLSNSQAN